MEHQEKIVSPLLIQLANRSISRNKLYLMTLGDYLEQHGLSLRVFAKTCGVSASTIHRVRNGDVIPNRRLIEAIYRETGGKVSPADLIGISEATSPPEV